MQVHVAILAALGHDGATMRKTPSLVKNTTMHRASRSYAPVNIASARFQGATAVNLFPHSNQQREANGKKSPWLKPTDGKSWLSPVDRSLGLPAPHKWEPPTEMYSNWSSLSQVRGIARRLEVPVCTLCHAHRGSPNRGPHEKGLPLASPFPKDLLVLR